jgi:hypothetical protein
MGRWTIINVLLGLIVLLLAIEVARTWARSLPPVEVVPRAPAASPPEGEKRPGKGKRGGAQEPRGDVPPPAMVAAIAQKDLFDPSRQAATEDVAAPVARVTEPPPNVTVVGVRIFGKDSEVFVTDASQGNQQKRLRIGDQVGGYTVKAIDPTGLTLASPSGDEVTMSLAIEKGKAPPARPATAARTPQAAQTPALSPAAGPQGASPAAGVPVKPPGAVQSLAPKPPPAQPVPPVQPVPAVTPPGTPPAAGQNPPSGANLPSDVQQKLEQLRHREPRSRAGRTP